MKQTVRGTPGVISCLEACVSCCFRASGPEGTNNCHMCCVSSWVLDLMSTGLLIPVDAPYLTLLPLPTETLCYRHLQQTHSGANGVAHGVSAVLSAALFFYPGLITQRGATHHWTGPTRRRSQAASADVWGRFRLSPQMLKVHSYT